MERKERKRLAPRLLAAALLLLLGLAAALYIVHTRYALFENRLLPRNTEVLDLRGRDVTDEELTAAREALPGARILYDVSIGGKRWSCDEREIVTGPFTEEDIPLFSRFEELVSVDATACEDLGTIYALQEALPGTEVFWTVALGGEIIPGTATDLALPSADAVELAAALRRLPLVRTVTVSAAALAPAEQKALCGEFGEIAFRWPVQVPGGSVPQDARELSFAGTALDEEDLASLSQALTLLPAAERIDFTDTGLQDGTLLAFAAAHRGIFCLWTMERFGRTFTTADEVLTFDGVPLTAEDAEAIEALIPAMPRLRKVEMIGCGISDEDMETINLRHEDVQFVWMVRVYDRGVRTDQTFFHMYRWTNPDTDVRYPPEPGVLAGNLRYCHDMIAVDLGHQHIYEMTGAERTSSFLTGMPHLKYLMLSNCAHDTMPELASLQELVWLELFKTSFYDFTPLLECKSLRHLNIVYARVPSEERRAVDLEQLRQMTWLERLWLGGNMFSEGQVNELRQALPNTEIKVVYGDNTLEGGWRGAEEYFNMRDALHMYYMTDDGQTALYNPYTGERSRYEWTDPFRRRRA